MFIIQFALLVDITEVRLQLRKKKQSNRQKVGVSFKNLQSISHRLMPVAFFLRRDYA